LTQSLPKYGLKPKEIFDSEVCAIIDSWVSEPVSYTFQNIWIYVGRIGIQIRYIYL
jgi:hypothetical protein